jgi:rod shape-determining protein MreC
MSYDKFSSFSIQHSAFSIKTTMYNLRRFIIKHHFVILFILLEVISVLLLANSQRFHRDRMVNTTNDVVGKIYEWSSEVGNYFRLNSANEQLAEENALLRQRLSVVYDTTTCTFDISEGDTLYKYIPAQVVNNSTNQANNYIIINKGKVDGIERDMGVISTDGIVGVVTDVSRHFASVMSLLHSKSVVGVRIKESQELASLKWETNNYRYGMVEDIPTHILLQKGDTILTSSHSYIFPEDLMVGTVEEFYPTAVDALNKAKVRFATDFATLRHVYVIRDLHKPELDSLKARLK